MAYLNYMLIFYCLLDRADQVQRILKSGTGQNHENDILYFTEEGGKDAGVHGRGPDGSFFTILEGPSYKDETSGLAFSPDGYV